MPVHYLKTGGPIPKFTDYHLWKTMVSLDEIKPIGRKKLAFILNVGEGSTRTILNMIHEQELISINKSGVTLTKKGVEIRNTIYFETAPIVTDDLTIKDFDFAVKIPYAAKKVQFGCEERDIAIKSGASGATTLVCFNGKLMFPGSEYPVNSKMEIALREKFKIKNDDVILIGTGDTPESAEIGAISAAIQLIGGLRINHEEDGFVSRGTANELLSLAFAIHDLVGGLPVCAKSRDNLGIRIENGTVIDNAYTGAVLEEVMEIGTTIRKIAISGPYKGIRVIVTPIEIDGETVAAIGVVDIRSMTGCNNLIRGN